MTTDEALKWLKSQGTQKYIEGLARYGINTKLKVFGVSVGTMQSFAKRNGKDHELAAGLWKSGWYEGQMLAVMVEDPAKVTRRQMNSWATDFDNWGIVDTACFHLFDKTPFAWDKVFEWAGSPREFVKRSSFALMASLVAHDKTAPETKFLELLPLIEEGAKDERNFVKKGVNWALRCIGKRSLTLNKAAVATSRRLAASDIPSARWIGKDALRELTTEKLQTSLKSRAKKTPKR